MNTLTMARKKKELSPNRQLAQPILKRIGGGPTWTVVVYHIQGINASII